MSAPHRHAPPTRRLALCLIFAAGFAHARPFELAAPGQAPVIVHDGSTTVRLAADLLARDLPA